MTRFEADHNRIQEIPSIGKSNQLQYFSATYNEIEAIDGLAYLKYLNTIRLDYNNIADLTPVSVNINLIQIDVWDNPVTQESIDTLTEYSVIVNYNPNFVPPEPEEETEEDGKKE